MITDLFWRSQKSRNLYFTAVRKKDAESAMIFLPGMGASYRYWSGEYYDFAKGHSLYFLDLLGFGFSAKPRGSYTLKRHAQALHTLIRQEVREPSIVLVGHSLGALVALAYLHSFPHKVAHTFLLSLPHYRSKEEARKFIKKSRPLPFLFDDTPAAHISCMLMCMFRSVLRVAAPLLAKKGMRREVVSDAFLHTHTSYFSTLQNCILRQDIPKLLEGLEKDKLVLLHGSEDKTAPFTRTRELTETYGLKLVALEGEGHNFPLHSPAKVREAIKKEMK